MEIPLYTNRKPTVSSGSQHRNRNSQQLREEQQKFYRRPSVEEERKEVRFELTKRWLISIFLIPLAAFSLSFLYVILARALGPCLLTLNPVPAVTDVSTIEEEVNKCVWHGSSRDVWLVILSQVFDFGGPFWLMLLFFPFYMAYPEFAGFRKNKLVYCGSFIILYCSAFIILGISLSSRRLAVGFLKAILMLYNGLFIPLYFRRIVRQRERNLVLCQMEHGWTCCSEPVYFREPGWSFLELTAYFAIALNAIRLVVLGADGPAIAPILIAPVLVLAYIIWRERDKHFYREYSHTLLLSIMPVIVVGLCIYTWRLLKGVMLAGDWGAQIALLILYNFIMLLLTRSAKRWSLSSVESRHNAVVMLFPFRFIEHYYQYWFLYTVRDVLSAQFWIALMVVIATNILDTTGLVGDLYDKMIFRIRNTRFSWQRREASQEALRLQLMNNTKDGNLPAILLLNGADLDLSSSSSQMTTSLVDPEQLADIVCFTLSVIQQKCFCMVIVAALISFQIAMDLYADEILGTKSVCSISCNFQNPMRGFEFIFIRQAITYMAYILVALVAVVFWRVRVRELLTKYPMLAKYSSSTTSKPESVPKIVIDTENHSESDSTDIASLSTTANNSVETLNPQHRNSNESSTKSADILAEVQANIAAHTHLSPYHQKQMRILERERKIVISGSPSQMWSNPLNICFMVSSISCIMWGFALNNATNVPPHS